MKSILHISSNQCGTLSLNGQKILLGDKKVHVATNNNVMMVFEPNNTQYEKVYLTIPAETSSQCIVAPYHNGHYDVIISPQPNKKLITNQTYSATHGKIKIVAHTSDICTNIKIFLDNEIKNSIYTPKLNSITSKTNCFVIITANCQDKKYMIVLDENFKIIINSICIEVEENDKTIKMLTKLDNIICHGRVYTFDTQNNTYTSYLVYLNNLPITQTDQKLIPLHMINAYIAHNYTLAKSYFSNPISISDLQDYFGNIKSVYYNPYDKCKVNYTTVGDTIKSYNFLMQDNKIEDIEEVEYNNML